MIIIRRTDGADQFAHGSERADDSLILRPETGRRAMHLRALEAGKVPEPA